VVQPGTSKVNLRLSQDYVLVQLGNLSSFYKHALERKKRLHGVHLEKNKGSDIR